MLMCIRWKLSSHESSFVFLACQSDVLASLNALRFLIQGALYNELKNCSAAEKVRDIDFYLLQYYQSPTLFTALA